VAKLRGSVRNLLAYFGGVLGHRPHRRRQTRGRILTVITMLLAGQVIVIGGEALSLAPPAAAAAAATCRGGVKCFGNGDAAWDHYYNDPANTSTWSAFCKGGGGKVVVSAFGVPACGPTGETNIATPGSGGGYTPGFQCVELSERFLYVSRGWAALPGNGAQVAGNYSAKYGAPLVSNGTAGEAPQPGDVMSFSNTSGFTDTGHTGVVTASKVNSSGNGTIDLLSENIGPKGRETGNLSTFKVTNWKVARVFGYAYSEWVQSGTHDSDLQAVSCTSARFCMAAGYITDPDGTTGQTLIEKWNGTRWTVVSSPNAPVSRLDGVSCASTTFCMAVGAYYDYAAGKIQTMAEKWNGENWSRAGSPNTGPRGDQLSAVSCTGASSCMAAGSYYTNSGSVQTMAEKWNGKNWSLVKSPNASGTLSDDLLAVSCAGPAFCMAAGYAAGATSSQTLAEKWNGTRWSLVSSPKVSGQDVQLSGVSCRGAGYCMAVGYLVGATFTSTLAEHWNGTRWSLVSSPDTSSTPDDSLNAASCPSTSFCVAAGQYADSANFKTLAEKWNGTRWGLMSSPNPDNSSLTGDQLFAVSCTGAGFCMAAGVDSNGSLIAKWNGNKWTTVRS
jgi:hypothetical protein